MGPRETPHDEKPEESPAINDGETVAEATGPGGEMPDETNTGATNTEDTTPDKGKNTENQ